MVDCEAEEKPTDSPAADQWLCCTVTATSKGKLAKVQGVAGPHGLLEAHTSVGVPGKLSSAFT